MRFAHFLRRLGCQCNSAPTLTPYKLTIVGSGSALQLVKSPLYQKLRLLGLSISKAQSSMLHEGEHPYTSLTIHGTSQYPVALDHLAHELGQKEGIHRVYLNS